VTLAGLLFALWQALAYLKVWLNSKKIDHSKCLPHYHQSLQSVFDSLKNDSFRIFLENNGYETSHLLEKGCFFLKFICIKFFEDENFYNNN
jgi:hypothetical protein